MSIETVLPDVGLSPLLIYQLAQYCRLVGLEGQNELLYDPQSMVIFFDEWHFELAETTF